MSSDVIRSRKASCQHCGETLVEDGSCWVAGDGSGVCIEAEYGRPFVVLHTPMPEGLRGAPE